MRLTIEDVAGRAGVDVAYVRRLSDLGALGPGDLLVRVLAASGPDV